MEKKVRKRIKMRKMCSRFIFYPVRNNVPLLCPVHHAVQGSAVGLGFIIIPAGFNAPLGFESRYSGAGISNGVYPDIEPFIFLTG